MTIQSPPVARIVPQSSVHHGRTLVDNYAWLQQKDDPEVLAYLEAENAYARHAALSRPGTWVYRAATATCARRARPTPS